MFDVSEYLTRISRKPSVWLSTDGPDRQTVISSRVRLARNLMGHLFCQFAKPPELHTIQDKIIKATQTIPDFSNAQIIPMEETTSVDRILLKERHLISQELTKGGKNRAVIIGDNETSSIMVNEEDHIRIQCIEPGLGLNRAWERINKLDDELDEKLPYAFSREWGYLTACPTNVGTGIRASVMLHLPALSLTKQLEHILQKISQSGLAVRGFYGENSEPAGDLFQFSNQISLGQTELDLINTIEGYVKQIIGRELNCRKQFYKESKAKCEDVVYRAHGVLANARMISSAEAMRELSYLRLGVYYGWIDMTYTKIDELILLMQPAHLQKSLQKDLTDEERDRVRADLIRFTLTH